jgi:hypothetical protein
MAIYFLDSSAIVKHYQAEVGTAAVDRVLSVLLLHFAP